MARFVFRLETVLKQRKRLEQEAQRELAVRHAKLVEAQNALKQLDEQVKSVAADVRENHLTGQLDLNFLAAHRRFLNAMQRRGMELVQHIAQAQLRVNEARKLLAEAAKQRKVVEKLRERQFARWKEEQDRKEANLADEIGVQIGYANLTDGADN